MKKICVLLPVLLMAVCACDDISKEQVKPGKPGKPDVPEKEEIVYNERAMSQFEMINRLYRVSVGNTSGLYNENYPKGSGDGAASYLWPYDGLMSGVATLYELGYDVNYAELIDQFEKYWSSDDRLGVGAYSSGTDGSSGYGDRFFDDNSIVGLDLVEAYRLTGDRKFLDRAKRIISFLKKGEDSVFGGGLWWNESLINVSGNVDSNKPACANGFATLFLLKYYEVCPASEKSDVLDFAKRLYSWLTENLRDPEDALYWNDKQAGGSIRKDKWTYNSGAMISNGVLLARYTGEQSYLDQAKETAMHSYDYFVRPVAPLALAYPDHDPWFTVKLINAYIDIEPYMPAASGYITTFMNNLDYAWEHSRTPAGLFYEGWAGNPGRASSLLQQDAALEALGRMALYKKEVIVN